jgi:predicted aspartyl protease
MPSTTRAVLALLVVATCSWLPSCAWHANAAPRSTRLDRGTVSIDASWSTHRPVVRVYLESRGPYRFLIDTGAESTAVSPECAREVSLDLEKSALRINAAGGASREAVEITTIGELRLGGARFTGVPAFVTDMGEELDGVLGFPVFADLLLTLDGPGRRVILERGRLPAPEEDARCLELVPGDLGHESPRVWGRIAGHRALILVDSGYTGALYLARNIPGELGLAFVPDPEPKARVQTQLGSREVTVGRLNEKVELASLELEGLRTTVGMGPPVILGGRILQELVTTFDQRSRRVRFLGGSR